MASDSAHYTGIRESIFYNRNTKTPETAKQEGYTNNSHLSNAINTTANVKDKWMTTSSGVNWSVSMYLSIYD